MERLLKKINEKCSNLANFPNMGRKRNELLPLLRSFAVDDYLIFYRAMSLTGYAYAFLSAECGIYQNECVNYSNEKIFRQLRK
ncbi:type II toxin-antitoxin system RelE/ParE family toxin [uncultured Nostoc sp.]|uniref:type II toxin-antitoxin system RelE/ParE family toxin n=1 Tax=uncultured Nostoc sp. TaxID=340711 RepID=UPI0035CB14B2